MSYNSYVLTPYLRISIKKIEIINYSFKNKKFTQEGVEEMEQVLDGLSSWGREGPVKRLDKKSPKITNSKECLKKYMHQWIFTENHIVKIVVEFRSNYYLDFIYLYIVLD
jgi:hypothetical protein